MGGNWLSNRMSTTLPRTETTAPRFEGLVLFFIFALADAPSVSSDRGVASRQRFVLRYSVSTPLPVTSLGSSSPYLSMYEVSSIKLPLNRCFRVAPK